MAYKEDTKVSADHKKSIFAAFCATLVNSSADHTFPNALQC